MQQAQIVKQDELTRLHRDNERLLAEARQMLKEQRIHTGQLEQQERLIDELRSTLAQANGATAALEERAQHLQAEVARLNAAMDTQQQQEQQLRERLDETTLQLNETAMQLALLRNAATIEPEA
ncbi:hypothetical protein D3C81_924470 [compost metagenome]